MWRTYALGVLMERVIDVVVTVVVGILGSGEIFIV